MLRKALFIIIIPVFLSGCFFKFSGTDTLYTEGKKSNELVIKRVWCSQCGCEAVVIQQMEKKKMVYEMVLNCTEGCPPGERSYKIERQYDGDRLIASHYYFLVKVKDMVMAQPISAKDSMMITKLKRFRNEPFFQHYCLHTLNEFKGFIKTDSANIIPPPDYKR
jgi:hypothetical protein